MIVPERMPAKVWAVAKPATTDVKERIPAKEKAVAPFIKGSFEDLL